MEPADSVGDLRHGASRQRAPRLRPGPGPGRLVGCVATVAPSLFPATLVLLFAIAGLVVLLRNPTWQDGDGLIGTLFSLQHMTLFFWGQDRFANLVPALASPFGDPQANLAVQLVVRTVLGTLAPLFVCVFLTRTTREAWLATLLSSALLLAATLRTMQHEAFIQASPYGTSFALAGLALLMFRQGLRTPAASRTLWHLGGAVLIVTAYFVNISLVLIAGPILLGELLLFGSELALVAGLASLAGLALCRIAMTRFAGDVPTPGGFARGDAGLVGLCGEMLGEPGRFILAMIAATALIHLLLRRGGGGPGARPGAHAVLAGSTLVASTLIVSLSAWVVLNHSHPRYLLPAYILAASLCGAALLSLAQRSVRGGDGLVIILAAGLLLVAVARPAPRSEPRPGPAMIDPGKRALAAAVASIVLERSLDGVAGAYWDAWPAVFQAEQDRHDAGLPPGGVFGVAARGQARRAAFIARLIEKGRLDIACIDPDPEHCYALAVATMRPPATTMQVGAPLVRLPDGRLLTFVTLRRVPGDGRP